MHGNRGQGSVQFLFLCPAFLGVIDETLCFQVFETEQ